MASWARTTSRRVPRRALSGSAPTDPHAVLGVSRRATASEIRDAYFLAARATHPDLNPGDSNAKLRFQEVQRAYQHLKTLPPAQGGTLHNMRAEPFAPRSRAAAPDERHFDYATWRAWHYGDNATQTDSVRQAAETRTRHQSFFAKRNEAAAAGSSANGRTTHRQLRKDRDNIASRLYERQRARRASHQTTPDGSCAIS